MDKIVQISNLKKYFEYDKGLFSKTAKYVKAVDDVSVDIERGSTLAVVGESGSGKTTLARTLLRLTNPTSGSIMIDGKDFMKLSGKELRKVRSEVSVVFQNPSTSLNPQATIGASVMRPLIVQGCQKKEARERALDMLRRVSIDESMFDSFPHQLSGGQQQRVSIARALISQPRLLILDEPTSALDISVQSQILNLLLELQQEMELTYLFITHDLNVVRYMADMVAVMYHGKMVEYGSVDQVFGTPQHPYTRVLMSNMPILNPRLRHERKDTADKDTEFTDDEGCCFRARCADRDDACLVCPVMADCGDSHLVLCHKACL